MKTSRVFGAVVATLAMFAAADASADTPGATGGTTAVLNTYTKVLVDGDSRGPNKLGKITGAGTMDAAFAWNEALYQTDKTQVELLSIYTRSANNPNGNNSYMQGGVAFATLTAEGVKPGATVDLPQLNGDRTFMRPIAGFLSGDRALLMAASEDNGVNNNPQPVAYVINTKTGALLSIPNSTRGQQNINKPTNLIRTATQQGIQVNNPQNQRGPHTIQADPNKPDTYVVGMQYNNQAQEAYSITVNADNSIKMNWLVRYSNTAQHCRPQVAIPAGSQTGYIAAVEANNQPAEIGFRVTEFNVATGKAIQSKIAVRSQPNKNVYVSEPVMAVLGDKLAITYGLSSQVRQNNNNDNGHAGGKKIDAAVLLSRSDLNVIGAPALGVGQFGRHGSSFVTNYGPNSEPALAVISGSSTGTGGGFLQMYPLKADGTLGVKDPAKVYQVSPFSDVANVQARGKRNPNNQARGFINGLGNVPNPGYTTDPAKAATSFMPEVKTFSFSTVTGYSGAEAMAKGIKNSIWLSLVPATWQEGLATTPGKPTDTPGTGPNGEPSQTGPAPRSTTPGTDPTGEATNSPGGGDNDVVPDGEDNSVSPSSKTRSFESGAQDGCSVSHSSSTSSFGLIGLAIAGALVAARRKREEA